MAKQVALRVIIPTAINVVGLAHENIVTNLLRGQTSDLELPSMYKRAMMISYETGEIFVTEDVPADKT